MKPELILIPLPATGHLVSATQFAKLLSSRDEDLSIRILILKLPFESTAYSYVQSLQSETIKGIQFTELAESDPEPESEPEPISSGKPENPFVFLAKMIGRQKSQVRDLVAQFKKSASSRLAGLVLDMFATEMMDVANEFEIPAYIFYTSGAAAIGLWLDIQTLIDERNGDIADYKDSETEFSVSTYINPVPVKLFPSLIFEDDGLFICGQLKTRLIQNKGIIVNTFQDLESHALRALKSYPEMPPVYPVGPLINFDGINTKNQETEIAMRWLDDQPISSVVFLCFGSFGSFDINQAKEIAKAIEGSGCRFLWSLRRAPSKDHSLEYPSEYENYQEILPKGFLQRTCGFGKIIGWAPQVDVLGHPAVGAFVTHCGWNSVLESVWFGVPMAVWPMYAEQQANAFQMVKDLGIAVEIKMDYNIDPTSASHVLIKAIEIENGIRQLMQPEAEVKRNVKELMEKARSSMEKRGSSYISFGHFLEDLYAVH